MEISRFQTGAVRENEHKKNRPDLISPFAEERLGELLRKGAEKYTERNWEKGMPASRSMASLCRHLMQYRQGDRTEDHLAAVACNAMFLLDLEEKVYRGLLPVSLMDLPKYRKKERTYGFNNVLEDGEKTVAKKRKIVFYCRLPYFIKNTLRYFADKEGITEDSILRYCFDYFFNVLKEQCLKEDARFFTNNFRKERYLMQRKARHLVSAQFRCDEELYRKIQNFKKEFGFRSDGEVSRYIINVVLSKHYNVRPSIFP